MTNLSANIRQRLTKFPFVALAARHISFVARAILMGPNATWALASFADVKSCSNDYIGETIKRLDEQKSVSFLQIGSNDGKHSDPIFPYVIPSLKWKGVLVEPLPFVMQKLKNNYKTRPDLIFEQKIVASTECPTTFYYIDPIAETEVADLPEWYDQLGGFSRNHIVKHLGIKVDPYIRVECLPTTTLASLLKKHEIVNLDLLHIDTEGADYQILKQLNLRQVRPNVIICEFKHLRFWEAARLVTKLRPYYALRYTDADLIAIERNSDLATATISK